MGVKYPQITVNLSKGNGNAFSIMSRVRAAMREAYVPRQEVEEFTTEANSGDYDHLLQTVMKWVKTT